MDGEFFKVTDAHLGSNGVGLVELAGGARAQHAIFYNRSVHDPAASNEAGRPRYKNVVYVRVAPPGERLNIVDRPASGVDARTWPQQWALFQQNQDQVPEGTPVNALYADKPAVVSTLQANGVWTVEQLADLSGNAIDNIGMGSQKWVNDAKKYLEITSKGVGAAKFKQEMEDKDRQINVLKRQVEDLSKAVREMQSSGSANLQLEQIQQLIAGAMGRPQFPNQASGQVFDVAAAQINANHPTTDIKKRKRLR